MMTAPGWCPFATSVKIPTSNYTVTAHERLAVVLHIMDSGINSCINWFKDPASGVSSHFGIGKKGELYQFVNVQHSAHANGLGWNGRWFTNRKGVITYVNPTWALLKSGQNPTLRTLSIEHEGRPGDPITPAMEAMQTRVLRWLTEEYGFVYVPGSTLIGHYHLDNIGRSYCPGPAFVLAAIAQRANAVDYAAEFGRDDYAPTHGIETAWREHYRDLREALGKEETVQYRPFAGGHIIYFADGRTEVILG